MLDTYRGKKIKDIGITQNINLCTTCTKKLTMLIQALKYVISLYSCSLNPF